MVSTRTGEAAASKGSSDKARIPLMIDGIYSQPRAAVCIIVDNHDGGEDGWWKAVKL